MEAVGKIGTDYEKKGDCSKACLKMLIKRLLSDVSPLPLKKKKILDRFGLRKKLITIFSHLLHIALLLRPSVVFVLFDLFKSRGFKEKVFVALSLEELQFWTT